MSQIVFFEAASLIFSSFSDRLGSKSHTRYGIAQGLIRFRDIDLDVKGQGQKKIKPAVSKNTFCDIDLEITRKVLVFDMFCHGSVIFEEKVPTH